MPSSRATTHTAPGGRPLAVTVVVLCVLGLMPLRFTESWVKWFGDLAWRVFAPVSHPMSELARWVSPDRATALSDAPEAVLAQELELTRQKLLREQLENGRLRRLVDDLQRGFALDAGVPVRLLARPIIGNPSDLSGGVLIVRAGSGDGVTTSTVATYDGMQLVGRVERVQSSVCEIRPITARRSGRVDGVVMLRPDGEATLNCSLTPNGDGTLSGPVTELGPNVDAPDLALGQDVRLMARDGSWPTSAQMLLIGRVVAIDPAPGQPLRRWITVEPLVELRTISQAVLRIPVDGEERAP